MKLDYSNDTRSESVRRFGGASLMLLFIYVSLSQSTVHLILYSDTIRSLFFLNNILLIMIFAVFMLLYVIRRSAINKAKGFKEVVFPYICVLIPAIGLIGAQYLSQYYYLGGNYPILEFFGKPLGPISEFRLGISLVILLISALFGLWALVHLWKSFSIRAEVRELVLSGPYAYVRHPLYTAEFFTLFAFILLYWTWFVILITIIAIACQVYRAKIEESKLTESFPEYTQMIESRGMFFPLLGMIFHGEGKSSDS